MEEKDTGFEAQQTLTVAANDTLVFGASYRKAKALNEMYYTDEHSIDNAAVFVNNTWEFLPSWSLNTGVRYDKHSDFGSETTMSAGLNKNSTKTAMLTLTGAKYLKLRPLMIYIIILFLNGMVKIRIYRQS